MPVDSIAVETAKTDQRNRNLPCRECSFDEALFSVSKNKLTPFLKRATALDEVPEQSEIYANWRKYVLAQIRLLVDEALYAVFETDDLMRGHADPTGRKSNIVSAKHDVVLKRVGDLVRQLEPELHGSRRRKRISGVRITVANTMNTIDWSRHAKLFWQMQVRS